MKLIVVLALTATLFVSGVASLFADGENPPAGGDQKPPPGEDPKPPAGGDQKPPEGGGSAFDEPKEGEETPKEAEPTPKVFTFKDYKLEMETKDGRWWKVNDIPPEEVEKGVALNLTFKLPKSPDHFDVQMFSQGWKVGGKLAFKDGTEIGIDNYKMLSEKHYEDDMKEWKEVRDAEPPKKVKMANAMKTAYRYAFTGLLQAAGNFPLHKEMYFFKFKDRTYWLQITYTTTSMKNERVLKEVEAMLKSLREKPERR